MAKNNILTFEKKSKTGIYWLTETLAVFPGPTTIGIIAIPSSNSKTPRELYLIDSGPDRNYCELLFNSLDKEFKKFKIKAIFATHSHADHVGANAQIVKKTGCKIYATKKEKPSIECPELQSAISYGGNPLPEYKTSYYLCESSHVDKIIKPHDFFELAKGIYLEAIPLPGHYFEMTGFICTVPEKQNKISKTKKIFFTSDGIFTRSMLSKYWIPFIYDIGQFKKSLDIIKSINADYYIPSHGDIYTEISALYELNMISVIQNEQTIIQCLKNKPCTFEDILKYIADTNDISMRLSQFMLVGSTIRSYITELYCQEKITWTFIDNKMYWKIKNSEQKN